MKKVVCLLLAGIFLLLSFPACEKDPYTNRSVAVPAEWPRYQLKPFSYHFEAGFTPASYDGLTSALTFTLAPAEAENKMTVLSYLQSPERDIGTKDYLCISFYETAVPFTEEDLISLADQINNMDLSLSEGQMEAILESSASMARYGGIHALTFSLILSHGELSACLQFALFARESILYQIVYSDFTTAEDNDYLEKMLSSVKYK